MIASAVIKEGKYAQAFPAFGPERRGAPVLAFTRISDEPILIRSEIYEPDIVIVLDSTLLRTEEVTKGLKLEGILIINTTKTPKELKKLLKFPGKIVTIDATKIALEELKRPIVNTAILGAVINVTKLTRLETLIGEVRTHWPGTIGELNTKAVLRAYNEVIMETS
jgi:pyruvate ferredoxin oxidoreductase gamma subunit/2-oxoisovalerate ferredoxin oxidoreductase gamma subunit